MGTKGIMQVNYTVSVNTDIGEIRFVKRTVWGEGDPYKIFTKLFPILKTFKKKDVKFYRCWESFYPFNSGESLKSEGFKNKYDKDEDDIITEWFNKNINKS